MELNDALSRILSRHARWVAASVLIGLLVAATLIWMTGPSYSATGRLQATGIPPSSDTEAAAVSDRIDGIATSTQVLRSAMQSIGLRRPVVDLRRQVLVTRVGSSGVVDVTVTDHDPRVALSLARNLTKQTSDWIDTTPHDIADPLLADVDNLMKSVAQLRSALPAQSQNRAPALSNMLADLQSQRQQLLSDATSEASASIISAPEGVVRVGSHTALKLCLGLLLGLVVGLMLSALHEMLRPTVGRVRNFARAINAPLLGHCSATPDGAPADLASALILAARRQAVRVVAITGPISPVDLGTVKQSLELALAANGAPAGQAGDCASQNGHLVAASVPASGPLGVQRAHGDVASLPVPLQPSEPLVAAAAGVPPTVTVLNDPLALQNRRDVGLVVVAADFASARVLGDLDDTRRVTGWPIIGVIDATGGRRHQSNARGRHKEGLR